MSEERVSGHCNAPDEVHVSRRRVCRQDMSFFLLMYEDFLKNFIAIQENKNKVHEAKRNL